jgi:uncharacterized protein YndB with AHSA1/START domain
MNEQIKISTLINAAQPIVWAKYTEPAHIVNWNFASDDWCCPHAANDMKVGGLYDVRMEAKDGSFGFDFKATFTAVEPGQGFTYRMKDGRMCTVQLISQGDQTEVQVSFDPENMNPIEMQQAGWQAILNNFKAYVEK